MTNNSYYDITLNLRTSKLVSVETNNTNVIILHKYFKKSYINYTITTVVYNSEGMSSHPTSRSFGM